MRLPGALISFSQGGSGTTLATVSGTPQKCKGVILLQNVTFPSIIVLLRQVLLSACLVTKVF